MLCPLCQQDRPVRELTDGGRFHSWKESDGQGWDTLNYPCANQPPHILEEAREYVLADIISRKNELQRKLDTLRTCEDTVRHTKNMMILTSQAEKARE